MTPAELLALRGSIPGLLRRGSPVFWRDEITPSVVTWIGPWPDCDPDDGAIALIAPGSEPCIGMAVNACSDLALDLSDATGRAHAAWWLLAALWGRSRDPQRPPVKWRTERRPTEIEISCDRDGVQVWFGARVFWAGKPPFGLAGRRTHIEAQGLSGIDPEDPRLLPDGSRWVDAEALRLVCLHVAGLGAK